VSPQTHAVRRATARLVPLFEQALRYVERHIDPTQLELIEHDTLARVQLGSGLIVINSLLEANG
jgi:hypothetical protein